MDKKKAFISLAGGGALFLILGAIYDTPAYYLVLLGVFLYLVFSACSEQ
jgi:hypothetical protein